MWYLEHVFYHSVSNIHQYIKNNIFDKEDFVNPLINLGFGLVEIETEILCHHRYHAENGSGTA